MRELSSQEIEGLFERTMDLDFGLKPDDIENVRSLMRVGEWLIAFETMCRQICEWQISLPVGLLEDLRRLGESLGAASAFVDRLWDDAAG